MNAIISSIDGKAWVKPCGFDNSSPNRTLLAKGQIKRAESRLGRLLRLKHNERVDLLILRARVRLSALRIDEALADLEEVRSSAPQRFEDADTLVLLADCHFARYEFASVGFANRQDADYALSIYQRLIDTQPTYDDIGWVWYQRGRAFLALGERMDDSIESFRYALLAPSKQAVLTAFCYERLSFIAFYERRAPEEALPLLEKAIGTYPSSAQRAWLAQVHMLRARALLEVRPDEITIVLNAITDAIDTAVASDTLKPLQDTLLNAAETLKRSSKQHDDRIIEYLNRYLQMTRKPVGIDVTFSRIYEMLGDAYRGVGGFDAAISAYERALHYNPYTPWELTVWYQIAYCHYQQGDYTRTVRVLQRMLAAATQDDQQITNHQVFHMLGNAHLALEDHAAAYAAYTRALELAPANAHNLAQIMSYRQIAESQLLKVTL